MYCIPEAAEGCPITKVSFGKQDVKDKKGKVIQKDKITVLTSTDSIHGLPII